MKNRFAFTCRVSLVTWLCVCSTVTHAESCYPILGLKDTGNAATAMGASQVYKRYFCDRRSFSSTSTGATSFGAQFPFPVPDAILEVGASLDTSRTTSTAAASEICDLIESGGQLSQQQVVAVQKVAAGVVQAWGQCMNRNGLNWGIEVSASAPRVFAIAATYRDQQNRFAYSVDSGYLISPPEAVKCSPGKLGSSDGRIGQGTVRVQCTRITADPLIISLRTTAGDGEDSVFLPNLNDGLCSSKSDVVSTLWSALNSQTVAQNTNSNIPNALKRRLIKTLTQSQSLAAVAKEIVREDDFAFWIVYSSISASRDPYGWMANSLYTQVIGRNADATERADFDRDMPSLSSCPNTPSKLALSQCLTSFVGHADKLIDSSDFLYRAGLIRAQGRPLAKYCVGVSS